MEEQVYSKLSMRNRELLADLWETEVIKAIASAGDIYQQDKAAHVALVASDYENVLLNRGNIFGARFIYDLVKLANKKQKKAK